MADHTTHSDETTRATFERFWTRSRGERKYREAIKARREDGTYVDGSAQRHWWTWQCALRSTGAPPMVARAFEIADEAMFELLVSEGVPSGSSATDATAFGLVAENGQEVQKLDEASPALQDAFAWLQPRGFVELDTDGQGEFIAVLRRPGEDT